MAGIWHDEGENRVADILFGDLSPDDTLYLGLHKDSYLSENDTLADITEVSGSSYSRMPLNKGDWVVSGDIAEYAEILFEADGEDWDDVDGYFITNVESGISGGILIASEEFSNSPYDITDGDKIAITPKVTVT